MIKVTEPQVFGRLLAPWAGEDLHFHGEARGAHPPPEAPESLRGYQATGTVAQRSHQHLTAVLAAKTGAEKAARLAGRNKGIRPHLTDSVPPVCMSLNCRLVSRGGHIASDSLPSGGTEALGSIFMLDTCPEPQKWI